METALSESFKSLDDRRLTGSSHATGQEKQTLRISFSAPRMHSSQSSSGRPITSFRTRRFACARLESSSKQIGMRD
jgi:hypothetical protein